MNIGPRPDIHLGAQKIAIGWKSALIQPPCLLCLSNIRLPLKCDPLKHVRTTQMKKGSKQVISQLFSSFPSQLAHGLSSNFLHTCGENVGFGHRSLKKKDSTHPHRGRVPAPSFWSPRCQRFTAQGQRAVHNVSA